MHALLQQLKAGVPPYLDRVLSGLAISVDQAALERREFEPAPSPW